MEQFIRNTRVTLDSIILIMGTDITGSREVSIVKTNLQEAQMFFGLLLGSIGTLNPYKDGNDTTSEKINDRADVATMPYLFPNNGLSQIGRVKHLRSLLQDIVDETTTKAAEYQRFMLAGDSTSTPEFWKEVNNFAMFGAEAITSLIKAKLWLGQQLNNINEVIKNSTSGITEQPDLVGGGIVREGQPASTSLRNIDVQSLAKGLYDIYSAGVGGVNFKGDPLPGSEEFFADPEKQKQADGWVDAANYAIKTLVNP